MKNRRNTFFMTAGARFRARRDDFVKMLRYHRLAVSLALILVTAITVTLVPLGLLLMNNARNAVDDAVLTTHREIAVRTSREIGSFIERVDSMLRTTAVMIGTVYPSSWKQEMLLVELVLDQGIFMRAAVVDISGEERANSEVGRGLQWEYPGEAVSAAAGQETYISDLKMMDGVIPYVTMAVPVRRGAKVVGVLIADANLREIWDIVDTVKVGETGKAFIVSSDGVILTHREDLPEGKDVYAVLRSDSGSVESKDERGRKWVSLRAPVPVMGWQVVLRQEQDEIYRFLKTTAFLSWSIILFAEVLALVMSVFLARFLIRPIRELVCNIRKVADGDLEHIIESARQDEIGELVRALNNMTAKLRQAKERVRFAAIGMAVSRISHELKNSLVVIKSFIQMFPDKHKNKLFIEKFTRVVPEEVQRLENLLRDISDVASFSKLDLCDVNISEFLMSLGETMEGNFERQNITVTYDISGDDCYVRADPRRLKQVFINLMINAMNAMPEGGTLTIRSACVPGNGPDPSLHMEIKVGDTGKGIIPGDEDKIFEPFYTRNEKNMGLGLTISRKIIEQHGGTITVENSAGSGATFVVRLPLPQGRGKTGGAR